MKKSLILFALVFVTISAFSQKVSILGDSYSTFGGYMSPEWNLSWYNGPDGGYDKPNDVKEVEQTWWWQFIHDNGLTLELNNSFSGTTVCTTGYSQDDYSDRAFISRILDLGDPDIIVVFGGTNDSWAKAPVGEYQFGGWRKEDLAAFRPAFAYLMANLRALYPNAEIYNLVNSELSPQITDSQALICERYAVVNIPLHDIDKQMGHPSIAGMRSIADQLTAAYKKDQPKK